MSELGKQKSNVTSIFSVARRELSPRERLHKELAPIRISPLGSMEAAREGRTNAIPPHQLFSANELRRTSEAYNMHDHRSDFADFLLR